MITKKRTLNVIILSVICLIYSPVSGLTIKKMVSCPQGVNEKDVINMAISECQKLGYSPEQEGGKLVFTKGYDMACVGSIGIEQVKYVIIPSFTAEEDGRKVFTLGGEYLGKPLNRGHRGECFECEMNQIEKAVKTYLETK